MENRITEAMKDYEKHLDEERAKKESDMVYHAKECVEKFLSRLESFDIKKEGRYRYCVWIDTSFIRKENYSPFKFSQKVSKELGEYNENSEYKVRFWFREDPWIRCGNDNDLNYDIGEFTLYKPEPKKPSIWKKLLQWVGK
jgi:hypothetical protein